MHHSSFIKFFNRPVLIGLLMFCFLMFLTQYISYERYLLLKEAEMDELNNEVNATKERLQTALSYSLSSAQTLGFIIQRYGVPDDFDTVAKKLLTANKFIDIIQVVEGGVITKVYPLKGNEVVIGYNILKDSVRNKGAFTAIETKKFFWAGPINLKQGGVGIVGRQPIFKNDKFWGFSAVIIKLSTFLHAVGIDSLTNNGFYYQLSRINNDNNSEEFFLSNNQLGKPAFIVPVEIQNGEWRLYVAKKSSTPLFFAITFSCLGFVLSILGGLLAWFMARQPQRLKKLVQERTAQLIVSQNNYQTTVERVSDALIALDNNWRYTFLNDAALATHPLGLKETLGQIIWDVHPDLKGTIFWDKYHEAMETRKPMEFESYYAPMDRWFSARTYPSADGLTIFYQDTTESKKSEQEILREKNLSDSIINSLPGVFYLYDETGKFLRWNKNFETVSGYSSAEVSLMHPIDFFGTDEKERLRVKIEEVFIKGVAEIEADFLTKDKRRIPYYFNGHLANFDDKDYLIGMGIDISDRKKVEQEIVREKNLSDSIINSLPGVFYLSNLEGELLRWNRNFETVSGYTTAELSNMRVRDFVAMDEQQSLLMKKELAIEQGVSDIEAHFYTKQKKKLPYHFTSVLAQHEDEPCLLGVGIDITESKKDEEKILLANNALRNLSAHLQTVREEERSSISRELHDELGQQLTALKMDISWIGKKINPNDILLKEKIAESSALLDETVKTIRRINTDLRPGIIDDPGLCAALDWQAKEFTKRTGIACLILMCNDEPVLDKDISINIFRIFQEALTNITKYAKATQVLAELKVEGKSLLLSIRDNGIGFDKEEVQKSKSFGLLGMSERAIAINGAIEISSAKGKGTTIDLILPINV